MIRLGVPNDSSKYVPLDGEDAFKAHQAGAIPEWRDGDALYFKRGKKLYKILDRLGIQYN